MKYLFTTALLCFALALGACATDEPRHASPPPGSHSPFSAPDERDPASTSREHQEPEPEQEEEEEPLEPGERP